LTLPLSSETPSSPRAAPRPKARARPGSGVASFFVYRHLASLAMLPYISAMTSMISDMLGRGSDAAVVFNRRTGLVATVLQLVLTRSLSLVPHPRYGFRLAASFSLCSFVLLLLGARETLPPAKRLQGRPDWKSLVREFSPLGFLEVFGRTRAMRALAVCTVLNMHAGTGLNNGTLLLFRKHKHGWGQAQQSNQMLVAQACGLCESAVQGPVLRKLGLGGALCWGERLGALTDLNTAASPDQRTFYLNPVLQALRQSPTVLDRALDAEARLQGVSQGRLAAAEENLTFVFRLLMPSVFSELYVRTLEWLPGANFLASAACQLVNSEIVAPWAWRQLSQETLDQVSSA